MIYASSLQDTMCQVTAKVHRITGPHIVEVHPRFSREIMQCVPGEVRTSAKMELNIWRMSLIQKVYHGHIGTNCYIFWELPCMYFGILKGLIFLEKSSKFNNKTRKKKSVKSKYHSAKSRDLCTYSIRLTKIRPNNFVAQTVNW